METPLILDLRSDSGVPLHRQVYQQIQTAILTGRLRSQQKLPASRQLARALGISRTTVTQSYDQLISEGYLETRRGAGTFVCAHIPDAFLSVHSTSPTLSTSPSSLEPVRLSAYGKRLIADDIARPRQAEPSPDNPEQKSVSFRYWRPDLAQFPLRQWQRLVNRYSLESTEWMTYSTEPMGYRPLREAIATYIAHARGVDCQPEQILITQGTQQAIGLIAQVLLDTGDAIALENPGYLSARKVFTSYGAHPIPIAVDTAGMVVKQLAGLDSPTPKLAYVTPSHQFPTGALMSLSRRLALLDWAQQTGGLIVEDDYDSEFRYAGRPIPALQGLDTHGRVLYVGTFSKVMFPALRLGYVVLPSALVPVFGQAKWVCDRQCSRLNQIALAAFIREGHLASHIRRMRTLYATRRDQLVNALKSLGPVEILGDAAGLHIMVRLPMTTAGLSTPQLVKQAQCKGVNLLETKSCYLGAHYLGARPSAEQHELIFGFGGLSEADIEAAIDRLRPLFNR